MHRFSKLSWTGFGSDNYELVFKINEIIIQQERQIMHQCEEDIVTL